MVNVEKHRLSASIKSVIEKPDSGTVELDAPACEVFPFGENEGFPVGIRIENAGIIQFPGVRVAQFVAERRRICGNADPNAGIEIDVDSICGVNTLRKHVIIA